ncbi:MAG: enoyl-CoA hydratase/isomerase family protein [Candidatus Acidiferrales bacterium]
MAYEALKLAIENDIAVITLNLPDKRNAITPRMLEELQDALGEIENGPARVGILTGAGKAFCAGMDIETLQATISATHGQHVEEARRTALLFRRLWGFPKPMIAAVNGAAIAGGCGLATLCDFTLSAPEAKFGFTEVKIGFIPAIVSVFLSRQIGGKRARDLLLSGRVVEAAEAHELGLVTMVVAADSLMGRAKELAATLVAASPSSLAHTKRLLIAGAVDEVDREIEAVITASAEVRETADFREGVAAFLEKRPPRWTGK